MSPQWNIQPKSASTLTAQSTPTSGSDLEVVPWDLFDTNTASFANAAVSLSQPFFQTVQTDGTLGNMQQGGMLPSPQWLEPAALAVDILAVPSFVANAITGALSDIANILKTCRACFNIKLAQKDYGTFPLMLAHSIGGEQGFGWGSFTAPQGAQYGNNGISDGGWWLDGAITIPSQQPFSVILITSSTALTLTQTPMPVRVNLWGALHRRVL